MLLDRCVRPFGFRYEREIPDDGTDGSSLDRRYGLVDAAAAARRGYRLAAPGPPPPEPELTRAQEDVVHGTGAPEAAGREVPVDGCLGEANRQLAAQVPRGADLLLGQNLTFQSFDFAKNDSRVRAAFGDWSACMRRSGLSYATPLDPLTDDALMKGPAERNVAVAVADVTCKRETDLVGTWYVVETAYQRAAIRQAAVPLRQTRAGIEAQLRLAASLAG